MEKKNLNGHVVFNKGVFFVQNFTTSGKSLVLTGAWSHPPSWCWGVQHIWTGDEPGAEGLQHIWRELSLTLPWVSLEQQLWQGGMGSPAQGGFPWVCVCSLSPGRVSQLLSPLHPRTLLRVWDLLRDWFDSHIPWDRTDQTAVLGSWHRISELPFTADRDFGGLIFHQGFCCCSLHKRAVSY